MRALLPMLLGAAASARVDEPEAPPLPERPDPLADLSPWPDPYAEEPAVLTIGEPSRSLTIDDWYAAYERSAAETTWEPSPPIASDSPIGRALLGSMGRGGSARPSVVTFTAAERIERARQKQARKAAKRIGEGR